MTFDDSRSDCEKLKARTSFTYKTPSLGERVTLKNILKYYDKSKMLSLLFNKISEVRLLVYRVYEFILQKLKLTTQKLILFININYLFGLALVSTMNCSFLNDATLDPCCKYIGSPEVIFNSTGRTCILKTVYAGLNLPSHTRK